LGEESFQDSVINQTISKPIKTLKRQSYLLTQSNKIVFLLNGNGEGTKYCEQITGMVEDREKTRPINKMIGFFGLWQT